MTVAAPLRLAPRAAALPPATEGLRAEVRGFLTDASTNGVFEPRCDAWLAGFSPEFSRELGRRGWIGMTWSDEYGGHARSALERFVVAEELLAAGAPVAAHWIADRQSGPQLYRHGTETLRRRVLPGIARGECYFALGMSEPNSGSDLASVKTRADRIAGGWRVSGTKVWTSHAHHAHYLSVLCRTSDPAGDSRHAGLSVLVVDLAAPGVTIRPIRLITGEHHFNEVILDGVDVSDDMLVGEEGEGWALVTAELSLERSGPERFLSTFPLLAALTTLVGPRPDQRAAATLGALVAELTALRSASLSVAAAIDEGRDPVAEAALVKDLGTRFEVRVADVARSLDEGQGDPATRTAFQRLLAEAILSSPGFSLRGGTNEILRGIVARALGVR